MLGQAHHAGTRIVEMMTEELTPRSILKQAFSRRSEVPTAATLRPTRRCFVDQILFNSRSLPGTSMAIIAFSTPADRRWPLQFWRRT